MTQMNPEQHSSDYQLIFRIKNGDSVAFRELFYTYCQALIRFACRFTHDVDSAEDLVQEVFFKVWSNHQQLDPQLSIKSYLYAAVRNQALKQIRHQQVIEKAHTELRYSIYHQPTPEDFLHTNQIESAVMQTIEELPEKCRLIFTMNRFDNLTYAEIAHILELSVKTIETQMGRALKKLRNQLNHLLQLMVLL